MKAFLSILLQNAVATELSDRLYTEFGIPPIRLPSICCRNNVKCIM